MCHPQSPRIFIGDNSHGHPPLEYTKIPGGFHQPYGVYSGVGTDSHSSVFWKGGGTLAIEHVCRHQPRAKPARPVLRWTASGCYINTVPNVKERPELVLKGDILFNTQVFKSSADNSSQSHLDDSSHLSHIQTDCQK